MTTLSQYTTWQRHAAALAEAGAGYLDWIEFAEEIGCPTDYWVELWQEAQTYAVVYQDQLGRVDPDYDNLVSIAEAWLANES